MHKHEIICCAQVAAILAVGYFGFTLTRETLVSDWPWLVQSLLGGLFMYFAAEVIAPGGI